MDSLSGRNLQAPADGNQPNDPESTNTVPEASTVGTWVEEASTRPTMLYLLGLTDDYPNDGHVITQALTWVSAPLALTAELAPTTRRSSPSKPP